MKILCEHPTGLTMKPAIFSDVTLCSPADMYRRFRETCCLHNQDWWIPWWQRQHVSETSAHIYQTIRCNMLVHLLKILYLNRSKSYNSLQCWGMWEFNKPNSHAFFIMSQGYFMDRSQPAACGMISSLENFCANLFNSFWVSLSSQIVQ
jgi:hypothetical protein